jgi:hypothetical protein
MSGNEFGAPPGGYTWKPLGPSATVPGAVDVETEDGRRVPVPPDYVSKMQTTLPAGDIMANASRIRGDQARAEQAKATGAPGQLVTGTRAAAAPPAPPAFAPPAMPDAPQGTDTRNQFVEDYNLAVNLAKSSARPGGPRKKSVEKTESTRKLYTEEQEAQAAAYSAAKTTAENSVVQAKGTAFDAEAEAATERARAADA